MMLSVLLLASAIAAGSSEKQLTANEAWEIIEIDGERCDLRAEYDGGPALTKEQLAEACRNAEVAKKRLKELGINDF